MLLTVNANAKINWCLNITGVLENGYHEMDMLMQPISLCDTLEFSPSNALSLCVNGQAAGEDNLVLKAANALKAYAADESLGARIALEKRIPSRAGLGGGSADCAQTLKTLNRMWGLNYPTETLLRIGEKLGADVPFCLLGGLARVSGFGEKVETLPNAPHCALVVIMVGEGLSTPAVFREWDNQPSAFNGGRDFIETLARAIQCGDFQTARAHSFNALEAPAIRLMPEIEYRMRELQNRNAKYVRMSGSGSAVYGVFDSLEQAEAVAASIPGAVAAQTI